MKRPKAIEKELSANDSGETGAHQAGILVPKEENILTFFPPLGRESKNPRHSLVFRDGSGVAWTFKFIYYNNRFFGGTRNEYRLTCMTKFIRSHNLQTGDILILRREREARYTVGFNRRKSEISDEGRLKLGGFGK